MSRTISEVLGSPKKGEDIRFETDRTVRNWAETFECRPERFYTPDSEEQVVQIVNLARHHGKSIRVVGAAHSPSDIYCNTEWIMTLDRLDKVLSHDLDRRKITVQAGMRLAKYLEELESRGWNMDNLGSISEQSLAGAIATCTHGSSLEHGVISTQVEEITLVLADGTIVTCSMDKDPDLFRAALVSLGSLGIIIRLTMRTSPQYNLKYTTEILSLSRFLEDYDAIWASAMYVRAWWWPYTRKVVIWRGDRTESTPSTVAQSTLAKWYSSSIIDRYVYQSSLYALRYKPSLLPAFEKAIFRTKFPANEDVTSTPLVGKSHDVLQMDCLFSQYVDEWAIPLSSGVEAISRLDRWITNNDTSNTGIPVDTDKVFVHAPIEIRVSSGKGDHAFLSPARESTPVIWIGVIMYRPYFTPTAYRRYFAAYEHLMRSLGGKPHWAKQHSVSASQAEKIFGNGMTRWLAVRARVDPTGVFVNGFVKRHLLGMKDKENLGVGILDGEAGRLHKRFNAVL